MSVATYRNRFFSQLTSCAAFLSLSVVFVLVLVPAQILPTAILALSIWTVGQHRVIPEEECPALLASTRATVRTQIICQHPVKNYEQIFSAILVQTWTPVLIKFK